jgi:hypothetical protein
MHSRNPSRGITALALAIACSLPLRAEVYVVAPGGDDAAPGTPEEPVRTIQKGISLLKPGDRLRIRAGRYQEKVTIRGLRGTGEQPIVIAAAPGETVVLDGTRPVAALADGTWQRHRGGIYKIRLTRDVWQLIADGGIQTTARWPNAFWHDETIFDLRHWAMGSAQDAWLDDPRRGLTGHHGIMGNTPDPKLGTDLRKIGFDLTGAVAVLNVANYDTYSFPVTAHDVPKGTFRFRIPEQSGIYHRPMVKDGKPVYRFHKYFFEGKRELLDAPGEWHYDKASKTLYYHTPKGKTPAGMDIRGKVLTYALEIRDCRHVTVRGLDFFGATMKAIANQDLTVEDVDFLYPSYSKRVLGDWGPVETTVFYQADRKADFRSHVFDPSRLVLRNCTFRCADGDAVKLQGTGNVIENCLFQKIDYSCVDEGTDPDLAQYAGNGGTVHVWWSPGVVIRRCTIDLAGEAHNFMGGKHAARHKTRNLIEYCRASRCGRLHAQDGANFHIWQFDCDYMTMRHNWAHDTFKYPFRLDGIYHQDKKPYLDHCLSHHLVAFRSVVRDFPDAVSGWRKEGNLGICIKGDHHRTYHTTSFDNNVVGLFIRNEGGGGNMHSDTRNNATLCLSGARNGKDGAHGRVNGTARANWSGAHRKQDIREVLRDPDNLDFRPRKGSSLVDAGEVIAGINDEFVGKAPDIGAYEYGADSYWIPGYRAPHASTPIPPDGTKTAKRNCDLMWLGGYRAAAHHLHFGTSERAVAAAAAGKTRPAFRSEGGTNIFTPRALTPGRTYFWRVDAVGRDGKIVKGPVWSFTVGKD